MESGKLKSRDTTSAVQVVINKVAKKACYHKCLSHNDGIVYEKFGYFCPFTQTPLYRVVVKGGALLKILEFRNFFSFLRLFKCANILTFSNCCTPFGKICFNIQEKNYFWQWYGRVEGLHVSRTKCRKANNLLHN